MFAGSGGVGGGLGASAGGLQTHCGLEAVVDPPLETGQRTDHQNPRAEPSPQSLEPDLGVDLADLLAEAAALLALTVELAHHGVGGVRDNRAEDTSQVTRGEGDTQLGALGVGLLALREDVVVEELHEPLESHELDDRVGHLPRPERTQTLVEPIQA